VVVGPGVGSGAAGKMAVALKHDSKPSLKGRMADASEQLGVGDGNRLEGGHQDLIAPRHVDGHADAIDGAVGRAMGMHVRVHVRVSVGITSHGWITKRHDMIGAIFLRLVMLVLLVLVLGMLLVLVMLPSAILFGLDTSTRSFAQTSGCTLETWIFRLGISGSVTKLSGKNKKRNVRYRGERRALVKAKERRQCFYLRHLRFAQGGFRDLPPPLRRWSCEIRE
jgi:hypothetical protein